MTDIVDMLRQTRANMLGTDDEKHYWTCHNAADEIERLRAALKPFAYYADQIPNDVSNTASASGTVGDLRAAKAALEGK